MSNYVEKSDNMDKYELAHKYSINNRPHTTYS